MKRTRRDAGDVVVHVKGKNLTVTPALHDQVVRKMERLDKYLDRLQVIDVELCMEKTRDLDQQCHVEATTRVAGRTLRVTGTDGEMYAAVDQVVDKLYRRLNRRKERLKAHSGSKLAEMPIELEVPTADEAAGEVPAERLPSIVPERITLDPMFEDEAVDELEAGSREFLVFINARNEHVSVLYRRPDGDYGLIEPRARG
jgi:putative sigma-54 modulation protein